MRIIPAHLASPVRAGPSTLREAFAFAFEDAELSDMAKSFYRDNKRVSNRRIKEALGVVLKWPNYRDALREMLKSDGPTPPAPFDGLEVLRPARDYKNLHASILLTLEAATEAMEEIAAQTSCA
mgnify:CR=1 FL=1